MLKILKRFVHYQNESDFLTQLNSDGGFDDSCIVFIKDKQKIYTHGQYYNCGYSTATEETDGLLSKEDKQWMDIAKGNKETNGYGFYVPGEASDQGVDYIDFTFTNNTVDLAFCAVDANGNKWDFTSSFPSSFDFRAGTMSALQAQQLALLSDNTTPFSEPVSIDEETYNKLFVEGLTSDYIVDSSTRFYKDIVKVCTAAKNAYDKDNTVHDIHVCVGHEWPFRTSNCKVVCVQNIQDIKIDNNIISGSLRIVLDGIEDSITKVRYISLYGNNLRLGQYDSSTAPVTNINWAGGELELVLYNKATKQENYIYTDIPYATTEDCGLMSAEDKTKLDNLDSTGVAKLKTARTISVGTALTSTPTSFNGTSNITIPVTKIDESYLDWGSRSHSVMSPSDACFEGGFHGNVFSFIPPECITIEYSRDGGTTWKDYSTTSGGSYDINDWFKTTFTTKTPYERPIYMGCRDGSNIDTSNDQLRITFDLTNSDIYCYLRKLAVRVSTGGSSDCKVQIESRTCSNYTNNVDTWKINVPYTKVTGYTGWEIFNNNYGYFAYNDDSNTNKYRQLRFTFIHTHPASVTKQGFSIVNIFGYASEVWNAPMQYQKTGHLYSIGADKSATFPGYVKSTKFVKSDGEANQILMANGTVVDINSITQLDWEEYN